MQTKVIQTYGEAAEAMASLAGLYAQRQVMVAPLEAEKADIMAKLQGVEARIMADAVDIDAKIRQVEQNLTVFGHAKFDEIRNGKLKSWRCNHGAIKTQEKVKWNWPKDEEEFVASVKKTLGRRADEFLRATEAVSKEALKKFIDDSDDAKLTDKLGVDKDIDRVVSVVLN